MGLRFACAKATSDALTWGLKRVFHRPAGNFPGKMALYVDPQLLAHLSSRLSGGSIIVTGTNGKTTCTLMLADILEAAGKSVISNRTGANLDSGVATAMLQSGKADWGVFEMDEFWVTRVLPGLQSAYLVLTNLFPDQEERGGVAAIQNSIVGALEKSPRTTLIYNADDPHCAAVATRVSNPCVAFGTCQGMKVALLREPRRECCPMCRQPLVYQFRQYDQLGGYSCPACGWVRPHLDRVLQDVEFGEDSMRFYVGHEQFAAPYSAVYMAYNLGLVAVAAGLAGCVPAQVQKIFEAFDPQNGRLLTLNVGGHKTLVNLAKNPAGFDQNIRLAMQPVQEHKPCAVAFFVNNKEGDGHDASWIDDVSFEQLCDTARASGAFASEAGCPPRLRVFAGGMVTEQLMNRLKKAGFDPVVAQTTQEVFGGIADMPADTRVFLIANYTALPPVREAAIAMAQAAGADR